MSIKLRDLIRNVRNCKTAAEERAVIAKESALIRTAFKNDSSNSTQNLTAMAIQNINNNIHHNSSEYRHRNVAKLLFIHMLGYPSHFGQMECLKLIASPYFPEKKIGYLGLMLLLTDQEEVLTLVTNSIKNDLGHANPYINGLALTAVGNVASADMARDLAIDIEKLLHSENDYIRKKAALALIRVFKRLPELVEDFITSIQNLILNQSSSKYKNHAVLLTGFQLLLDVMLLDEKTNVAYFTKTKKMCKYTVRTLRHLLSMGYTAEYDVSGIADPFLQVKLLRTLRYLGHNNQENSDEMNDILAQVATNTETSKNAGNAILYECVLTIMSIEAESGLRVLAINILGRFLLNRDNNIRYVALNTLSTVVQQDQQAVQRHRNTIVDCLKDPDISIRQRALELIYALVNETNVQMLAREMLNYLVVAPKEQKPSLCHKIADAVNRYAPTVRWHIDTLLTMLSISGGGENSSGSIGLIVFENHTHSTSRSNSRLSVDEDMEDLEDCGDVLNRTGHSQNLSNSLIVLIQANPDLHVYVVHKLYTALKEDISQLALVYVGVWCIGEYGHELISNDSSDQIPIPEYAVVDLLSKILTCHQSTHMLKSYVLNAMIKLTTRLRDSEQLERLTNFINRFQNSMTLELQQRSCEYSNLLLPEFDEIRKEVLMKMPIVEMKKINQSKKKQSDLLLDDEVGGEEESTETEKPTLNPSSSLIDLDDIFGNTNNSQAPPPAPTSSTSFDNISQPASSSSAVDLLSDIFATTTTSSSNNLLDGGLEEPTKKLLTNVYEKNGLCLDLELTKPNESRNDFSVSHIQTIFRLQNNTAGTIEQFMFQSAFPKYIKLQMDPPSSTSITNPNESITQMVKIQNTMHGKKPIMMRIKLQYLWNGEKKQDMASINVFPGDF